MFCFDLGLFGCLDCDGVGSARVKMEQSYWDGEEGDDFGQFIGEDFDGDGDIEMGQSVPSIETEKMSLDYPESGVLSGGPCESSNSAKIFLGILKFV